MKIGFNLLFRTTFLAEDPFDRVEQVTKIGYDLAELPIFEGDPDHYQAIGKLPNDQGLAATAVTVIPEEARSPVSEDPANRKRACISYP